MRRKKIGTKHFAGIIDITDPCYDKDVWCRMTADVKEGEYDCYVWRHTSKYVHNNEEYKDVRIGVIGIYLDGCIPNQNAMEKIGTIGVDAGLAGFFIDKPDYTDREWDDFCNSIRKGDAWIKEEGFFSESGFGDGCYEVYAYKTSEGIVALEIRFL